MAKNFFVIQLAPGQYVAKEGKRFTGTSELDMCYRFRSKIAARIVNTHRRGTIIPFGGSNSNSLTE